MPLVFRWLPVDKYVFNPSAKSSMASFFEIKLFLHNSFHNFHVATLASPSKSDVFSDFSTRPTATTVYMYNLREE